MKKINIRLLIIYIFGFLLLYLIFVSIFLNTLTNKNRISLNTKIPALQFKDQFGKLTSFKDYKGKYVLVDFWFKGCKPCIEEMKYFPDLLEKYKSDLVIISISIDAKKVTEELLQSKNKPFEFLIADNTNWIFQNDPMMMGNSYVKLLNITKYPTYLLFDKKGKFISSPESGLASIEKKIGGIFEMKLTLMAKNKFLLKFLLIIVPYSIVFFLITSLIFYVKRKKTKILQ